MITLQELEQKVHDLIAEVEDEAEAKFDALRSKVKAIFAHPAVHAEAAAAGVEVPTPESPKE